MQATVIALLGSGSLGTSAQNGFAEWWEQTPDPRDEGREWASRPGYVSYVLHVGRKEGKEEGR